MLVILSFRHLHKELLGNPLDEALYFKLKQTKLAISQMRKSRHTSRKIPV